MLCLPSRSTRSYQRRVSEGAHGEDRYVFSMSAGRLTKEPWRVARRRGAPRRAPGMLARVVRSPEPATRLARCRFAPFVAARPRRAVIALTCRELRVDRVTAECRRPRHATDSFQADSTSLTDTRSRTSFQAVTSDAESNAVTTDSRRASSRAPGRHADQPIVEVERLASELAARPCRLAPRAPRAVLVPQLAGADHSVGRRRHDAVRGGDTSIPIPAPIRRVHRASHDTEQCARRQQDSRA